MLIKDLRLYKLYAREYLRGISEKIHRDIVSLRSIYSVYRHWHNILGAYFFRKSSFITLHDSIGNEASLYINKDNVSKAVWLARILYGIQRYTIRDNALIVSLTDSGLEKFDTQTLLTDEQLVRLQGLYLLLRFNMNFRAIDKKHCLIEFDQLRWKVRLIAEDIAAGPLLPYRYEPYEYNSWFSRIVKKSSIFIDVGAYIGGYSVRACNIGAKVVAIEPDLENFSLLQENLELNSCRQAFAINVAAGSEEALLPLYAPGGEPATDAISLTRYGALKGYVRVLPLDSIVASILNSDEEIDLLKIDVEGFEDRVLKGARETLGKTRYIMIEVWPMNKDSVLRILSEQGFKIADMRKLRNSAYNFLLYRK